MKKFATFWTSFQKSLLDYTYYKDIAKASYWSSFKYLLFLLVCLSLVRTIQLGVGYTFMRKNIPSYVAIGQKELAAFYPRELELRISNGNLYTNVKEPYVIEFPKIFGDSEGKHLIVIDTKGTADDYPKYNTIILATKKALVFPGKEQASRTTTQLYYFSDLKRSVYMDHTEYTKMIQSLNPFFSKLPKLIDQLVVIGLILFPFFGGLLWVSSTLFGLTFLTIVIWLVEKIIKTSSYGYKTLFQMGMHGLTWSILFTFLLEITNQKVSFLYNLIFIAWMIFVLIKNKELKLNKT